MSGSFGATRGLSVRAIEWLATCTGGEGSCAVRDDEWAGNQGRHATPRVTQKDMDEAQVETWGGDPILVRPDQLVKR